nr:hypothetical protein [Tanacetum cinerariifolium]
MESLEFVFYSKTVLGEFQNKMAAAAQNINNTTIRYEKKMKFVKQPIGPAPDPETADPNIIDKYYEFVNLEQEVACIMLSSISLDLQSNLEKYNAFDMMKELKTMFEEQAKHELFKTVKAFHACKQEDGKSVSSYHLKMKSYLDTLERLGYTIMGKTLAELHAMLKLHEKGIPKKAETPVVLAIREGKIQNDKKNRKGQRVRTRERINLLILPRPRSHHHLREIIRQRILSATNCKKGLTESRKLKHGALSLYMGDGMRATVKAIRSFNLILPSGLIINERAKHTLDSYYIWNCRLGHINKKRMDMLQRDRLLQPTHDESHEKCKSCICGKMVRKPFPHQVERSKDLLGLIHTDVFQNEVENQLDKKIKAIRSDREGEYLSHEFVNHVKSCGIVSQLTSPYTPQHNRVSERRNWTLLDMVPSMMNLTTLPKSFWDMLSRLLLAF